MRQREGVPVLAVLAYYYREHMCTGGFFKKNMCTGETLDLLVA